MPTDPRPTLAAPDDDPWLWLEEVEGDRALAWVAAQNDATLARYADERYARDRDAVKAVLDRPDRLPFVSRRAAWLYNFWQDADHVRGIVRRTTLASYRTDNPTWETVLDVDALATAEGRYGVDRHVIAGVWGVESNFGKDLGGRPLVQSLTTLSCYAPRRRDYFRDELMATLKIIQNGDIDPSRLSGSWAGAFQALRGSGGPVKYFRAS